MAQADNTYGTGVADEIPVSSVSPPFSAISTKALVGITLVMTMIVGLQQQQISQRQQQHEELNNRLEELRNMVVKSSADMTWSSSDESNMEAVGSANLRLSKSSAANLDRHQKNDRVLQSTTSDNNTCMVPYTLATDYGIVGDGIADDTNALQAAIDAASASMFSSTGDDNKGGIVLLPKGLFYTTSSIIVPAGVTLQGQGYGSSPLSIQFDAGSSTIAYCGSTDYAVRIRGHGASMRDLAVYDKHCNGVYTDGGGILIDADGALVESVVLSNLLIYHFMGGPALHLHAQNFAGIAYSNFQNIRVRHAKEGIFMNAEDGSFVNSNSFLGGAISGGITDIALHAEGPGSCNDNKFYGIVIEPSQTNIAHVFVSGAKTNIRLLDVRLEGTEMMELNRPLIIIDDSSYGNVMNGMLGHNNIQADFNRNPEITFTTNKMVGVHPSPSNLLWNDGFHGLTADLTNGGGSMNGWSMPGQNWFGTILDASEDIYPNHRVLSIDYRNYGGAFKLQPANLPPSPAHSFATFGVFVRSSVPGALSVVMRSQNGNIISSSPNIGTPDKWEWVGMSSLYDKTAPYFYFNINGDVEITAPFFAYGQAPATPGTSFLPSSGGQLSGTLTLGVVDGFVPPGIKPLGANVNEWTLPTSDGNHFIVDSSTSTGSATLVTRLNAKTSTRFTKGTLITLMFPYAGIRVKGSGGYIKLKNLQDFVSTVHSSLTLLSGDSGTWSEVSRNV
eukprot:CAMPEP_0195287140 /NCGR_PEP_ID=MMETSP0707-20130614/4328_1 /TAXON_ID=33640 /ORGANISM="Asterionellopsis glacialis, Strain CCMP134" /LENGTH=728 /DNA_ID=CAMNT_0040346869 /DNA_START=94 /DNA_END=2280 /DNA_ORIENTATION=-